MLQSLPMQSMPLIVSDRMMSFLSHLPDQAFSMTGEISAQEDRLLFTFAPPGTNGSNHTLYGRVMYRWGRRDVQTSRVAVFFVLPQQGNFGQEVVCIQVNAMYWGAFGSHPSALPPATWRGMLMEHLPYGIFNYPPQ